MISPGRGPRILKGALVSVAEGGAPPSVIAFQYNPESMQRSLHPEMVGGEEGQRSEAVRFRSAPTETITIDLHLDASDGLNQQDNTTMQLGVRPLLTAIELLLFPATSEVTNRIQKLNAGVLEIAPLVAPRVLFVWGPQRVLPVRFESMQVTEELFDSNLNPVQATVNVSMRVLNYFDLSSANPGFHEFLAYQQSLEAISRSAVTSTTNALNMSASRFS